MTLERVNVYWRVVSRVHGLRLKVKAIGLRSRTYTIEIRGSERRAKLLKSKMISRGFKA